MNLVHHELSNLDVLCEMILGYLTLGDVMPLKKIAGNVRLWRKILGDVTLGMTKQEVKSLLYVSSYQTGLKRQLGCRWYATGCGFGYVWG